MALAVNTTSEQGSANGFCKGALNVPGFSGHTDLSRSNLAAPRQAWAVRKQMGVALST